jgi:hypothetical protein
LAAARRRRDGALDADCAAWLDEAAELCRTGGFLSWLPERPEHLPASRRREPGVDIVDLVQDQQCPHRCPRVAGYLVG